MFVDDVSTSSRHRLNQILHTLKHVHSFDLKLDESTVDEITTIHNISEVLKTNIVQEGAFNNWHSNPDYAKHMLIVEATRLYLKEIAPRRRPRKLNEGRDSEGHSDVANVGYWLMNFAETAETDDEHILKILNSFSRVGNELTHVGDDGKFQTIKDLIDHYETRANDAMNDDVDRRHAKEDIHALRVGLKLYKKHHADDKLDTAASDEIAETNHETADVDLDFARRFPDLVGLAKKYGIGSSDDKIIADEGNEFTGALAAAKAAHKDKFTVGKKQYTVKEDDKVIADEGNEFTGALAAAKAAHKDKFKVGNKQYTVKESTNKTLTTGKRIAESRHMQNHDYQASMARSELYRNAKYAMDMLKMIRPDEDIEPWIASALTTDAMYLDKIYHYLDYYTKFEPDQLPVRNEQPDFTELAESDAEIEEATGSIARANLVEIFEYSVKLFHMIQPGDKLEGWVAMKLTTASEGISSAKHYLDYKNFERHAAEHFDLAESRKYGLRESKARKDFKLVANLIKQNSDAGARHHMAKQHADVFAKKSPRFNRSKFFAESNANEQYPYAIGRNSRRAVREALDNTDQDLQQAETLIAAKSISDDLQSMAEKVARMGVDELMPLVDTMKTQFGPEMADAYNTVMKAQLDTLLTATQEAKDQSDDAVLALQNGSLPGSGATDIANLPAEVPSGEEAEVPEPEGEESDGLGTTPSAAGGNEPLGRAKKPEPPAPGGAPAELAEARRRRLGEKWDTTMKTAEKDKGKWDGWTLAKLKARHKTLMDKPTRTAAEQTEVKQINFAIRAKQKDKFGKIKENVNEGALGSIVKLLAALGVAGAGYMGLSSAKDTPLGEALAAAAAKGDNYAAEELSKLDGYADVGNFQQLQNLRDTYLHDTGAAPVNEAKKAKSRAKAKPDFLDFDKDGNKKEPMKKAIADKAKPKAKPTAAKRAALKKKLAEAMSPAGHAHIGEMILKLYGEIHGYGDIGLDYLNNFAPTYFEMLSHYEDLEELVQYEPSQVLVTIRNELNNVLHKLKDEYDGTNNMDEMSMMEAAAKSPYAIGMWQAKKEAGMNPNKPAKDLPKSVVTRGHKIARGIDKTDESIARLNGLLETAAKSKLQLESLLAKHRAEFAAMVNEGRTKDVLMQGQGLEGDVLQNKINETTKMITSLEDQIHAYNADSRRQMKEAIAQERKAYRFAQAKAANPWGVMVESANGARDYKFFKDQQARDYWVQLNGNVKAKLIGPAHFDRAASN